MYIYTYIRIYVHIDVCAHIHEQVKPSSNGKPILMNSNPSPESRVEVDIHDLYLGTLLKVNPKDVNLESGDIKMFHSPLKL